MAALVFNNYAGPKFAANPASELFAGEPLFAGEVVSINDGQIVVSPKTAATYEWTPATPNAVWDTEAKRFVYNTPDYRAQWYRNHPNEEPPTWLTNKKA